VASPIEPRRPQVGVVIIAALVALAVGIAVGWHIRELQWRWGTAAEWATGAATALALLLTWRALRLQSQQRVG
jgi:hypothetical protein